MTGPKTVSTRENLSQSTPFSAASPPPGQPVVRTFVTIRGHLQPGPRYQTDKHPEFMRKLKLQVQMTVDGFMAGPNGEMDWITFPWTDDINQYVQEITDPVDTIVLGRKLAEGFIPHWAGVAANPDNPDVADGRKFTDTPKVVFTKTLEQSPWENTVLAKGDLTQEITALKQRDGKDIIAYGGATFVSALIKHGLVDEFHLFINPAAIGNGMPIFRQVEEKINLTPQATILFACGITLMRYVVSKK